MAYLMSNLAIRAESLSKMYRIGGPQESYQTFRDVLTRAIAVPLKRARDLLGGQAYGAAGLTEEIWALRDVTFEVKHGEVIGIIGHNGAGKSTLLKVLSRITEPTTGYVDVYGRVGALLEVGTGFHLELTGRENVYLNGAILGMNRTEIDRKFDEIIVFAGVEKFVDTPVKHYSSGMRLRLGFAVAAHLEPEILVVDEVLAVGDAEFQKKCLGKMSDVAGEGRTVLFVSHNMAAVENLCGRVIVLKEGKSTFDGTTTEGIQYYLRNLGHQYMIPLDKRTDRDGTGAIRFTRIELQDVDANSISTVQSGQTFDILLSYKSCGGETVDNVRLGILCSNYTDTHIFSANTRMNGLEFKQLPPEGTIKCRIHELPLPPSSYRIAVTCKVGEIIADRIKQAFELNVVAADFLGSGHLPSSQQGIVLVRNEWSAEVSSPQQAQARLTLSNE